VSPLFFNRALIFTGSLGTGIGSGGRPVLFPSLSSFIVGFP
jgi:hypothetical protein